MSPAWNASSIRIGTVAPLESRAVQVEPSNAAASSVGPFIEIPFIEIPFIEIPFIEIPFIEIPFIEIPFIEIPFIEIPFIEIPFSDSACCATVPVSTSGTSPTQPVARISRAGNFMVSRVDRSLGLGWVCYPCVTLVSAQSRRPRVASRSSPSPSGARFVRFAVLRSW
jgi:hypothetical protein